MPFPTRLITAIALPLALTTLAGCAQPFQAKVARFQALPVPEGQTFAISPVDVRNEGGLEFRQYAQMVSQRLAAYGYKPVEEGAKSQLIVKLDYGVDHGVQKDGVAASAGFGPYGGWDLDLAPMAAAGATDRPSSTVGIPMDMIRSSTTGSIPTRSTPAMSR